MDKVSKEFSSISKPIIMNTNVLTNSKYLVTLARKAKGEAPAKIGKIIELYNLRKISQVQTAENVIKQLISADPKIQQKGSQQADKVIEKHIEVQTLSHRLRERKQQLEMAIKSFQVLKLVIHQKPKQTSKSISILTSEKK